MEEFIRPNSYAQQFAEWYGRNWVELGPQTMRQLRNLAGCSDATIRTGLRVCDDEILAPQHLTLKLPEGHDGWRYEPTDDHLVFVMSTTSRLTALSHEAARIARKERAVHVRSESPLMLGDINVSLELLTQAVTDLVKG